MERIKLWSATIIVIPVLWYLHHFFTHGGFVSGQEYQGAQSTVSGCALSLPSTGIRRARQVGTLVFSTSLMSMSQGSPSVDHKLQGSQSKKPATMFALWEVGAWVLKLVRGDEEECHRAQWNHSGNFRWLRFLPSSFKTLKPLLDISSRTLFDTLPLEAARLAPGQDFPKDLNCCVFDLRAALRLFDLDGTVAVCHRPRWPKGGLIVSYKAYSSMSRVLELTSPDKTTLTADSPDITEPILPRTMLDYLGARISSMCRILEPFRRHAPFPSPSASRERSS